MTRVGWSFVAIAAQLLQHEEREAAMGDLMEAGESAWQALADILGLVLHRQAALWKSWRPWLAGFVLAGPNSLALMGASVSVSQILVQLTGHTVLNGGLRTVFPDLVCQVFLLIAWSWSGGVCRGVVVATDALGERSLMCVAVLVLLGQVPDRSSIRLFSVSIRARSNLGSPPRSRKCSARSAFSNSARSGDHHTDVAHVERWTLASLQLGAFMAGMVGAGRGTRIGQSSRIGVSPNTELTA